MAMNPSTAPTMTDQITQNSNQMAQGMAAQARPGPFTPISAETYNYNSDHFAADAWSRISRMDWERYKQMYMPVEDYMASLVNNPAYNQQQLNKSVKDFDFSQHASVGAQQRAMKSYGLTLSPDQQQSFDRESGVQKGLGEVEAYNRTSRNLQDMQYAILGAGQRPDTAPKNPPLV